MLEKQRKLKQLVREPIPGLPRALRTSPPSQAVPRWEKKASATTEEREVTNWRSCRAAGGMDPRFTSPRPAVGMPKHTAGVSVSTDRIPPMAVLPQPQAATG